MADFGDIAGGINQGMAQNIHTIGELQRMQHDQQRMEQEKNRFDFEKKKMAEAEQPIFLDTFRSQNPKVGDNVFNTLKSKAEASGLLYKSADGREYFKRGQGAEFAKGLEGNAKEELIGAQLKDLSSSRQSLEAKLSETKNEKEQAQIKAQLDGVIKEHDDLSYQSTAFLKKKEMEIKQQQADNERKNMPSMDQIKGQILLKKLNGAKLTPEEEATLTDNKSKTEEQLTADALKGNKESQAILDAMEARKLKIAKANRAIITNSQGGGSTANLPVGKPGEINEGALQGLNSGQQAFVKKIANYEMPVQNLRSKEMMKLVERAALYDPTFDAKEYQVKQKVRNDFTSGQSSKTMLSLNTAIGHLESLAKAGKELENSRFTPWNAIANKGLSVSGDPRVTKFNTTANAVAGELATVFKNTSGTDQEIKSWKDQLSSSQSPEQIKKGGVDSAIELIGSRLGALRNKYAAGMGRQMDFQILSPKSRKILKGLGVDVDQLDPGGKTASEDGGKKPLSAY